MPLLKERFCRVIARPASRKFRMRWICVAILGVKSVLNPFSHFVWKRERTQASRSAVKVAVGWRVALEERNTERERARDDVPSRLNFFIRMQGRCVKHNVIEAQTTVTSRPSLQSARERARVVRFFERVKRRRCLYVPITVNHRGVSTFGPPIVP